MVVLALRQLRPGSDTTVSEVYATMFQSQRKDCPGDTVFAYWPSCIDQLLCLREWMDLVVENTWCGGACSSHQRFEFQEVSQSSRIGGFFVAIGEKSAPQIFSQVVSGPPLRVQALRRNAPERNENRHDHISG